jgi:methionyl-tRNA formyltransferase
MGAFGLPVAAMDLGKIDEKEEFMNLVQSSVRTVFMGTPEFAVPFVSALVDGAFDVVGVVTQPDRPKGRGQTLALSPVKEWALSRHLPVVSPNSLRSEEGRGFLKEWAPDLIVVVAYGKILPEEVLGFPKWGCINVHASLLPKLRGASPIVWAIRNGETVSGLSLMMLDQGMDTGPVLGQTRIFLDPRETVPSLTRKMTDVGPEFLVDGLLKYLSGSLVPIPQGEGGTLAPILRKEDGRIPFERSSQVVDAHVRAMNPWPGAFFGSSLGMIRVGSGQVLEESSVAGIPGKLLTMGRSGIDVACGIGSYRILTLQREGGKMIGAGDFLAGHRFGKDEILGEVPRA